MEGSRCFKYIVIGNGQEWCSYSWKGYKGVENVSFVNDFYSLINNHFIKVLCKKHFGYFKFLKKPLPFKSIWYPFLFKWLKLDDSKSRYILVFYDWGPLAKDLSFISYIKRRLPDAKLIYLFSNVVRISGAMKYGTLDKLERVFDQIYAFDKVDAKNYGFCFTPLIYTRNPEYKENTKEYDVFYIGNAKDRLDSLHKIYERCIATDLRCCFYINGVSKEKQLYPAIHYNEPLSYSSVLDYISKSKCMVDAIQSGSTAMTIKVCESVIYDKKLITTNKNVANEPFYSPDYFYVFPSNEDLAAFVNKDVKGFSNSDKAYFSPATFFDRINEEEYK